jgi:hypothetical protein
MWKMVGERMHVGGLLIQLAQTGDSFVILTDKVLLDLVVEADGAVRGVANPGRQNAPIRLGHFDALSGAVTLEGEYVRLDGTTLPFRIAGSLDGRTLRLRYEYGDMRGTTEVVRVEEYAPPAITLGDRLKWRMAA